MHARLLLPAALVLAAQSVSAVWHGPVAVWHRDPATTLDLAWIERTGREGIVGEWAGGRAGFGYGDEDDATTLSAMKGLHDAVFIRRAFVAPPCGTGAVLQLDISFDDGFIAWLNGREIARSNATGAAAGPWKAPKDHEAKDEAAFRIGLARDRLQPGTNVLAVVGLNEKADSSDFSLHPSLWLVEGGLKKPLVSRWANWEYLTGHVPEAGWMGRGGEVALPAPLPPADALLRHRATGTADWAETKIVSRPFAATPHRVNGAELEGLRPDTVYELVLVRGGVTSGACTVRTAPAAFRPGLRFAEGGDLLSDRKTMEKMCRVVAAKDPLFAFLGGDLAYANNWAEARWSVFLDVWHETMRAPDGRLIPMVVAIGNHENAYHSYEPVKAPPPSDASMYYSLFRFPVQDQGWYRLDFGTYLSFAILDSGHSAPVAAQTGWLRDTLAAQKGFERVFVAYHRPAYGAGLKPDAEPIQKEWCPLIEAARVDAVFEHDHHAYKRTYPMRGGKRDDEKGTLYIGDGAWSVSPRPIAPVMLKDRPWIARAESVNHAILVTLEADRTVFEALNIGGYVFDKTEVPRRDRRQPVP